MLTAERYRIILEMIAEREVVKLHELVEATQSSESTIRRDLSQLELNHKLKRVHGGAALLHQKGEELSITEKSTKNLSEKEEIGKFAAGLIRNGDCIYLDAGTTVFQMIRFIQAKDIKVVTNGLTHLEALLEQNIDTFLIGGHIKQKTRALIGSGAFQALKQFRFDKTFIGVNGIHPQFGYTTPDPEEALIKSKALQLGQEAYVLADHTKFHEVTFAKVADINEACIITNVIESEILAEYKEKTRIEVVSL
ncbi:DeoR family fructose operon transcriptional repressor [Bacillus mesophilus]|uniref:DeoR/GlpR transcriptional regulator n=1 Tax=Bacillus mesophilus TaxID=1808955 RepID=A0A6M0Q753_9BACI|nr:DeoR/GlpR family DNA-binding transcription regulator [Bacillus mesophilus]MBM7661493.1 DeoR family fructose operon transcriptional repressor [Bacillus mesophilus]NEY72164.1 DeoR/GlpR transcriptional regulator [Bacillus mesophilus]